MTLLASLHQVLVILHPVGVASDVDEMTAVDQPVDERGGHDLVAEHGAPLLESLVGGEHGRDSLVAGVDELEEEHGAVLVDRQVADLIDRQEGRTGEHAQPARQVAAEPGLGQRVDQPGEGVVVDGPAGFGPGDSEAYLRNRTWIIRWREKL